MYCFPDPKPASRGSLSSTSRLRTISKSVLPTVEAINRFPSRHVSSIVLVIGLVVVVTDVVVVLVGGVVVVVVVVVVVI